MNRKQARRKAAGPLSDLWRILNTKCEEASALASRSLDERLPWTDRLALAGHTLICRTCREFGRQLNLIRRAAVASASVDEPLPDEARARIAETLRDPEA